MSSIKHFAKRGDNIFKYRCCFCNLTIVMWAVLAYMPIRLSEASTITLMAVKPNRVRVYEGRGPCLWYEEEITQGTSNPRSYADGGSSRKRGGVRVHYGKIFQRFRSHSVEHLHAPLRRIVEIDWLSNLYQGMDGRSSRTSCQDGSVLLDKRRMTVNFSGVEIF